MEKIKSEPVKTVLIISMGFLVVHFITKRTWPLGVSLTVGLIGVFSTYLSGIVNFLWMKLTWVLSLIVPNILLGSVFYLILFPISLFSKLFRGKDMFMLKNDKDSTFHLHQNVFTKDSFEKLW